ncbi:MAG: hypothetical protein SF070_07645 [Gemmatimonadota bacterium]|nr:hypothetical protein [Gemmatimonadota bacterium]
MHVSPEQADQEFGPVGNAALGWLFALTGCAGLVMLYQFLLGSWSRPGHYGIPVVVGLVALPCLVIALRSLTSSGSPTLRVGAATLKGLAIFCLLAGAGMLVLLLIEDSVLRFGGELVLQPWAFGTLAWQVARRRRASESGSATSGAVPKRNALYDSTGGRDA